MKLSAAGLAALCHEEGFVGHVYQDQVGVPTIGYGHAIRPGESYWTLTEPQARELLALDVRWSEDALTRLVRVPLTQPQWDALVSLVFNIGAEHFATSTLLKLLNVSDYAGAADQFTVWRMGGGKVLPVLVARRARERAMFSSATPTTHHGSDGQPDMRDPSLSEPSFGDVDVG